MGYLIMVDPHLDTKAPSTSESVVGLYLKQLTASVLKEVCDGTGSLRISTLGSQNCVRKPFLKGVMAVKAGYCP